MGKHGKHRTLVGAAICVWLLPGAAAACRLALVLALDVSSSVDADEDRLQRKGLAAALLAPEVQSAFLAPGTGPVALAVFEWSGGRRGNRAIVGWRLVGQKADLVQVAETVARSTRSTARLPTALGRALAHAAGLFAEGPRCERRVLDVSGDGENNDGYPPASAYRAFDFEGVTVNALAIGDAAELESLIDYYRDELLRGAGAFVESAEGYGDFEQAMRRKLERELRPAIVGLAGPSP